jgi:phage terminase small subunit
MNKLTDKQEKFCNEYMIDLNAKQAAIRAGYSETTAHVIGPENLAKPCVSLRISELKKKVQEKTDVSIEWVVNKLKEVAEENESDRIPALDKLMKHLGGYEKDNKLDLTSDVPPSIIMVDMHKKKEG